MTAKKKNSKIVSNPEFKSKRDSKIDVITVWYNRAKYVEESIDSLIHQTHSDYSILAVDDGSSDETFSSLHKMLVKAEECGVPMRIWKKNNEGFTISLKNAIENHSDTQFIALHGAGDISYKNRLQRQYKLMDNKNVVATGVLSESVNKKGEVISKKNKNKIIDYDLKKGVVPRPGTHGCVMYDMEAYYSVGGYRSQFMYAQDIDLWLRLFEEGEFKTCQKILYKHLRSKETLFDANCEKRLKQIICYAAAIQSAIYRIKGTKDPITDIQSQNFDELGEVVINGAIDYESYKKLIRLLLKSIFKMNLSCTIEISKYLSFSHILKHPQIIPYILRSALKKFI